MSKYLKTLIESLVEEALEEQTAISTGAAGMSPAGKISATSTGGAWGANEDMHKLMWSGDDDKKKKTKKESKGWNLEHLFVETPKWNLSKLLTEAIIDDLVAKYPEQEKYLSQAESEGVEPKFLRWYAKMLVKGEEASKLIMTLLQFGEMTKRKKIKGAESDINRYKTLADLEEITSSAKETKSRSEKADDEVDILYRDSDFIVGSPKTHAASCKLGSETNWCISTPSNDSYWDDYTGKGIHFIIVHALKNSAPKDRFGIAVTEELIGDGWEATEIYDREDNPTSVEALESAVGPAFFNKLSNIVLGSKNNVIKPQPVLISSNSDFYSVLEDLAEEGYQGQHDMINFNNYEFRGITLSEGLSDENAALQGSTFIQFTNCKFINCVLDMPHDSVNISNIAFGTSIIENCQIKDGLHLITKTQIKDSTFTSFCAMTEVQLTNCNFDHVVRGDDSSTSIGWEDIRANNCSHVGTEFDGFIFRDCHWSDSNFSNSNWIEPLFNDCFWTSSYLSGMKMQAAIFRGVTNYESIFDGSTLEGATIDIDTINDQIETLEGLEDDVEFGNFTVTRNAPEPSESDSSPFDIFD